MFSKVKGVIKTEVGFMGGETSNPSYQDVCTDQTGHVEVVHMQFDPAIVAYSELLDIFWENHDPTSWDRQGNDVGSQYRSVIFCHTPEQTTQAQTAKAALNASGKYQSPVVTLILPATEFYRAEEYHQKYFEKKNLTSCPLV